MNVVVVNVGSRTVKLRVVGPDDRIVAELDADGDVDLATVVEFVDAAPSPYVLAHRIVHGGPRYHRAVRVDAEVLGVLEGLSDLAPLHNPPAVAVLRELVARLPEVPSYACFDTAFHATIPEPARTYALPWEWTHGLGVRRYGFHGLNHAYASRRAAELLGADLTALRIVTCHLGGGASLAAVAGGRSVDTTMGFTPLEGLVMATRSGSVDPGALLWLLEDRDVSVDALRDGLNHESGLLGLSGLSDDMRVVLAARADGHERAALAVAVYVHRLRQGIAAMTASLGGVDALVFTGGVGERSAAIRGETCAGLGFLGVDVDAEADRALAEDGREGEITAPGSATRVVVVHAREELEIARQVREALSRQP